MNAKQVYDKAVKAIIEAGIRGDYCCVCTRRNECDQSICRDCSKKESCVCRDHKQVCKNFKWEV